ncbi:MAG: GTP-binding protein [Deltaproteobacteria bacterium]|nr:GTP-binding protein [Deltaproteobacteria bacterium]
MRSQKNLRRKDRKVRKKKSNLPGHPTVVAVPLRSRAGAAKRKFAQAGQTAKESQTKSSKKLAKMNRPATDLSPLVRDITRKLPIVAIVGRPNVGKSTLFNRLVGERRAIVDDLPGVTRDRNYAEADWSGRKYRLIDTGGLDSDSDGNLETSVQSQSRLAVAEADVVVFLFDGKSGLNPLDREAVEFLRKAQKPVLYAVNKLDSRQRADNLYEFYGVGIERLYSISAEHGLGVGELFDDVSQHFPALPADVASDEPEEVQPQATGPERKTVEPLRVAVVGRPNVGKSTLINRLLGFERSVVDATPGTTRDSLDTPFALLGEPCVLIDTAGIRRKARIDDRIERFSVSQSLKAVERGDLIIHVIDGPENVTDQDAQILSYAVQRGKALLLAVNKWDLVSKDSSDAGKYREEVNYRLSFLDFAPITFISAATGFGVRKMLETAAHVVRAYRRKVSTSQLNQALQRIVKAHTVPLFHGRSVKFYYGTQTGTQPPTFTFFVNIPDAVPASYQKYLTGQLREHLGLEHAPIRFFLRARREAAPPREKPRR